MANVNNRAKKISSDLPPIKKGLPRREASVVSLSWRSDTNYSKSVVAPFTVESPVFDVCGYATACRNLLKGLNELQVKIALQPRWFQGAIDMSVHGSEKRNRDYITIQDDEKDLYDYYLWIVRKEAENLLPLIQNVPSKDFFLVHLVPFSYKWNHFEIARKANPGYKVYIGSTMFEPDRIPENWVTACNIMDQIWVPSYFNIETFSKSGVQLDKLRKVPLGVDTRLCRPDTYPKLNFWPDRFVFLSVFEWTKRKGWDVLLKAFCQAFSAKDPVVLIIRSSPPDKRNLSAIINEYIQDIGFFRRDIPEIVLIEKKQDLFSLFSLYETCDAFVLPSRGEGWGMPYLEAMAFRKPVIGTRWGASNEFMNDKNSVLIETDGLQEVCTDQISDNTCYMPGQRYANPSVDHLVDTLRTVFNDSTLREKIAAQGYTDAHKKWNHLQYARAALQAMRE
jgi:glycosyltransferase involved in cell wall biosynthesis